MGVTLEYTLHPNPKPNPNLTLTLNLVACEVYSKVMPQICNIVSLEPALNNWAYHK